MGLGSESAGKMVGPKWEAGPTEDVVQALLETLVDPLLPSTLSELSPAEDLQNSVAKQMKMVVLLYNYFHRKQKPELKFLDFVYFCKLAMVVRPPLVAFMKLMKESEPIELNVAEDQLSATEKAIKVACDISVALDSSRDVPSIEGWPISKVVVMLIDSNKEHCILQVGNATKGAQWLIEKELDESNIHPNISAGESVGNKRKRNNQNSSSYDTEFLQLGYDAVENVTGLTSSDLVVLGSHVTYSISTEKSASCFYLMQCPGSINVMEQYPLKLLVESLQGPLTRKFDYGIWKTTPAVQFHHLLPYVEFISCWLSGMDLCLPSLSNCNVQSITYSCEEDLTRSKESALSNCEVLAPMHSSVSHLDADTPKVHKRLNIYSRRVNCGTKKDAADVTDKSYEKYDILDSADNNRSETLEKLGNDRKQLDKGSLSGPPSSLSQIAVRVDDATEELNEGCDVSVHVMEASSKTIKILDTNSDDGDDRMDFVYFPSIQLSKTKVINDSVTEKFIDKHNISRSENKDTSSESSVVVKVDTVDSLKSNCTPHDDKSFGDKDDSSHRCNQTDVSATRNQPAQFGAQNICNVEQQCVSASEELQNALTLLYRRRQELYSRICNMEDVLELCEDNIVRVRDGNEVELARKCIKFILSENHLVPELGSQVEDKGANQRVDNNCRTQLGKHTRLSEVYLPGKSSCQDLEYMCLKNNWRMPRYLLQSTDGKFQSDVTLKGKDFKLYAKGGVESKPGEARDSAAAQMIKVILNACVGDEVCK